MSLKIDVTLPFNHLSIFGAIFKITFLFYIQIKRRIQQTDNYFCRIIFLFLIIIEKFNYKIVFHKVWTISCISRYTRTCQNQCLWKSMSSKPFYSLVFEKINVAAGIGKNCALFQIISKRIQKVVQKVSGSPNPTPVLSWRIFVLLGIPIHLHTRCRVGGERNPKRSSVRGFLKGKRRIWWTGGRDETGDGAVSSYWSTRAILDKNFASMIISIDSILFVFSNSANT